MQFPLFVILLTNFSELSCRGLHLSVETLRTQKLIGLCLNLQVLILHDIFDEEFAIAHLANVALHVRAVLFDGCVPTILLLEFFDRHVCLVVWVGPLLVPAFSTILQSAKVTLLDFFCIFEPFAAASTDFLIFLIWIWKLLTSTRENWIIHPELEYFTLIAYVDFELLILSH